MNVLIDIGHPAHVHLFKNFAWAMEEKGHKLLFTCRDKEFEIQLLDQYNFRYISFGKKYASVAGKIFGLIDFGLRELFAGLRFRPDFFLSHGSIYASHAASIMRKPHISFEDTFNFEQVRLYLPFTRSVLVGDYENPILSKKALKYPGYHELAYLHPKKFKPNTTIRNELNLQEKERYIILRFVSWDASHDRGHNGLSIKNKVNAVKAFQSFGQVIISSETLLPSELQHLSYNLKPEHMHHVLAGASLFFGESGTMAAEACVLGVPSIYIDDTSRLYTRDLEQRYGLCFNYSESPEDQYKAIQKGVQLLEDENLSVEWQKKRDKMLGDKIDVSEFLVWFVENYPKSAVEVKTNTDLFQRFK